MLSNSQLVDIIKANYNDDRMYAACLFIEALHKRTDFGGSINRYRMVNQTIGSDIISLNSYMSALDDTKLKIEFPFTGEKLNGDRTASFFVTPTNIELRFSKYSASDVPFSNHIDFAEYPDAVYNVQYLIGYMNDADSVLPLKIIWQRVIRSIR